MGLLFYPDQHTGSPFLLTIMKLSDIEDALRGNFVWDNSPGNVKALQTNAEIEGSPYTALIVFCGLSEMYGFEAKETAAHLSLTEEDYYRLINLYRKKMAAAQRRIKREQWDIEINDLVQKVWIKSKLIQNFLRLRQQRTYTPLRDLPNI